MSSKEGKKALSEIGYEKTKHLFPQDQLMNASNYVDRIIVNMNRDEYFNLIFK